MTTMLARIGEETLETLPEDLYIPPHALRVMLSEFEGPLDLLLWLIRRHKFDILDIPIAEVARQYEHYISLMQQLDIELAAEYLFMAAWLAEIKSRMLLPKPDLGELTSEDEEDPREALMARLLEYEGYRQAAQWLDSLQRAGRDVWPVQVAFELDEAPRPSLEMQALLQALGEIAQRQQWQKHHEVVQEPLALQDKLDMLLQTLPLHEPLPLQRILVPEEGRVGVLVTFMALLEMLRQGVLRLYQSAPFAEIQLERVA
ncbi:condensin subunit ScpA [Sulfurivirga caldicuralii]|uniref:Segregation and condensation protein A n=1 Tax=Sulfurivirga caldicuralii TaxID=364032 RepID=A0A1N6FFR0_9GAMM|nr:ScpA family protein [Sulfurivirga caldicuralii]SIN94087.1 condensin subunit ScpA [Sulfurivirga caldicuralii]